uniref:DnaJ subfamily B member 11 n=1 Tax=Anthurium amnicola TaxID=1678845 RepID=A0A1D1XHS5_9ARAE
MHKNHQERGISTLLPKHLCCPILLPAPLLPRSNFRSVELPESNSYSDLQQFIYGSTSIQIPRRHLKDPKATSKIQDLHIGHESRELLLHLIFYLFCILVSL